MCVSVRLKKKNSPKYDVGLVLDFNSLYPTETVAPPDLLDPRTLDEPYPHRLYQLGRKNGKLRGNVMEKLEKSQS